MKWTWNHFSWLRFRKWQIFTRTNVTVIIDIFSQKNLCSKSLEVLRYPEVVIIHFSVDEFPQTVASTVKFCCVPRIFHPKSRLHLAGSYKIHGTKRPIQPSQQRKVHVNQQQHHNLMWRYLKHFLYYYNFIDAQNVINWHHNIHHIRKKNSIVM